MKLSVLIIALSSFQMLSHAGVPFNHPLLAIHWFRSVQDTSEDSHFHSQSVQVLLRLLSYSSHLIQPVQSPFQLIISMVFVSSAPKFSLFFRPPTLFLQGLRFLNRVSILLMGSLSILFRQCFYPVILRKILTELQVHHPSLLFLVRWIHFKLSVLIIFLSSFLMLSHVDAPLNHSPLTIHLFRSVEDISEDWCLHS